MKKLLILALTSAFVAAANADATINWGVTTSTLTNASWKDNNAPGVVGSVFKIDADVGDEVALLPSGTAPAPQVKTVVTVEATFTAVSDYSSLELLGNDAKTALTVANDGTNGNKYYYWNPASEAENKWTLLGTTATPNTEQAVTVVIELDYTLVNSPKAKFTIGNTTPVEVDLSSETTLTGLAFAGTGDLTSVAATVTPAYAEYAGTRYETTAAAIAAKGNGTGDITMYAPVEADKYDLYDDANEKVYYYTTSENVTTLAGVFPDSGDGTENTPWEIRNLAELKAFQVYVATNYPTAGKYFQQTANITLDAAWPGIGIQNGKDLATGDVTEQGKFDAGAFMGTYDGDNHTISGFQMVGQDGNPANVGKESSKWEGLDYCGFFNSTYGATIKNLKIAYAGSLFATDTTASTKESGATFVGVAKNSTLRNLTTVAGSVSCSKGFGGIVGYLMGTTVMGTTVDSCTNNLNMTSLAKNKCGGIAMICQQENCSIRNCKNTGTMTTDSGEFGGIIGYTDDITISDCENTAACKMFHHHGGTVTLGGENKGNATVASYTGNATPGLNFATVSGTVATFVADNALASGDTYKVMATNATATATLTAGDTISFDETLFTPTYAIAAASGVVAPSTSGNVTTYTASTPVTVDGESTDATLLVSVPQNCKASQLIDTSNRDAKDLLRVLNKATNKYYQWEYDGNGVWKPNNVATTDGLDETDPADTVDLTRGEAVWVIRTDTSKPVKLNAVYTDDRVEVAVSTGYNLVAPALKKNETEFALSSLTVKNGSFNDKDMIVIPRAAAPINCVRMNNAWKVYSVSGTETPSGMPAGWGGIATGGKYEDAPAIPRGTGFFFVSKEAKTIEL